MLLGELCSAVVPQIIFLNRLHRATRDSPEAALRGRWAKCRKEIAEEAEAVRALDEEWRTNKDRGVARYSVRELSSCSALAASCLFSSCFAREEFRFEFFFLFPRRPQSPAERPLPAGPSRPASVPDYDVPVSVVRPD